MSVSTNEGGEFQLDYLSYWRDYGDLANTGIIPLVFGEVARLDDTSTRRQIGAISACFAPDDYRNGFVETRDGQIRDLIETKEISIHSVISTSIL
jgi:hypothetical protein